MVALGCRDVIGLDEFQRAPATASGSGGAGGTGGSGGSGGTGGAGGQGGSACESPNACVPEQLDTGGACGGCGHEERVCGADCRWGDWECIPGMSTFYRDADGDEFGDPDQSIEACAPPNGYVADNTDCDDTRDDVNPLAPEICANCVDEDCGGADIPCDLTASMAFDPVSPPSHSVVGVTITADPGHACVLLQVQGPGVDEQLGSPAVGGGGGSDPYTWDWDVTLAGAGYYTFLFTANNHPPCPETHDRVVCGSLDVN